jgi:hypothetical protein
LFFELPARLACAPRARAKSDHADDHPREERKRSQSQQKQRKVSEDQLSRALDVRCPAVQHRESVVPSRAKQNQVEPKDSAPPAIASKRKERKAGRDENEEDHHHDYELEHRIVESVAAQVEWCQKRFLRLYEDRRSKKRWT